MSLQVLTGGQSLVAIGLGLGDISSLVALGYRIGNWWTASSGDEEFLNILSGDEFEILRRRGLVDLPAFNKRWRKRMRLLAGGRPQVVDGDLAERATKDYSRFTAIMVCMTAALDQFASADLAKAILRQTLKVLLELAENGEDFLRAQFNIRFNAWRSTATVHGFAAEVLKMRRRLLEYEDILPGFIPVDEQHEMVNFFVWLLAGQGEVYITSSSDLCGIALCLVELGMDGLSVSGMGSDSSQTVCQLVYSKNPTLSRCTDGTGAISTSIKRPSSMIIPIDHPEECVSVFPLDAGVQNRCRDAWKAGKIAAGYLTLGVVSCDRSGVKELDVFDNERPWMISKDLFYAFTDQGSPEQSVQAELYTLAQTLAFVVNDEVLQGLKGCLAHERTEHLTWVSDQIRAETPHDHKISQPNFQDIGRLTAYTVCQSFFMGYYYELFFRLVDTSTLQVQTVDGGWGYRCTGFLHWVAVSMVNNTFITRRDLLAALCNLFLGLDPTNSAIITGELVPQARIACVGVVARRSLLANSLLGQCSSPAEVGGFTLLDVDVGGVPRDTNGLVRCGVPDGLDKEEFVGAPTPDGAHANLTEVSPADDVSLHIEPDWEGDPNTALLCVRYKGRRITTISPATSDLHFVRGYVEPKIPEEDIGVETTLHGLTQADISGWTSKRTLSLPNDDTAPPLLFQALNRPRLRYAAVGLYAGSCHLYVGSNSTNAAVKVANRDAKERRLATRSATRPKSLSGTVIIGSTPSIRDRGTLLRCISRRGVFCYEVRNGATFRTEVPFLNTIHIPQFTFFHRLLGIKSPSSHDTKLLHILISNASLTATSRACDTISENELGTMWFLTALFDMAANRDVIFYFYVFVVLYAFARNADRIMDWLSPPHRYSPLERWLRLWLVWFVLCVPLMVLYAERAGLMRTRLNSDGLLDRTLRR